MNSKLIYKCFECVDEEFLTTDHLEVHIAKEHYNFYPYECIKCNVKFSTKWEVFRHYNKFHKTEEFNVRQERLTRKLYQIEEEIKNFLNKSIVTSATKVSTVNSLSEIEPYHKTENVSNERKIQNCKAAKNETNNDNENTSNMNIASDIFNNLSKSIGSAAEVPTTSEMNLISEVENFINNNISNEKDTNTSTDYDHCNDSQVTMESISNMNITADIFSDLSKTINMPANPNFYHVKQETEFDDKTSNPRKRKLTDGVQCPECFKVISNKKINVLYHISHTHIRKRMFECSICGHQIYSFCKNDARKHARKNHNQDLNCMIDYRGENKSIVLEKFNELFGGDVKVSNTTL